MEVPETKYAKSGDAEHRLPGRRRRPDRSRVRTRLRLERRGLLGVAPYAQTLRRLASFTRLILFDKRGTGLSDRTIAIPTLEERMDDIRAVMDAAGSERAAVLGLSEGGQAAMVFAATYPARTQALVLWASNADVGLYGAAGIDSTPIFAEFVGLIRSQWGNGRTLGRLLAGPDRAFSPRALEQLGRWERNSATPAAAEAVVVRGSETDIGSAFNTISVPTLVIHRAGDPTVPVEVGRSLANRIPTARPRSCRATRTSAYTWARTTTWSRRSRSSSRVPASGVRTTGC